MQELEVKILYIDINNIREKLKKLNALNVKKENQINLIFDFPDRRLLGKKGYARIRVVEDLLKDEKRIYMTTKELISQEKYKIMDEHEIEISDDLEGINIYTALGLVMVEKVRKYRESYKYKDTLIEIDINDEAFCPIPYIEIETSNEQQLEEIVNLLGYTMKDTTSKTIYEILGEKGLVKGI
jgi:adenylate cyclase, class 2